MESIIAKLIWCLGGVSWYVIRYPFARRARRVPSVQRPHRSLELVLLAISASGMIIVPLIYVITDFPGVAAYTAHPIQVWIGGAAVLAALAMFRHTHKRLGTNWSVSLDIRDRHGLVA